VVGELELAVFRHEELEVPVAGEVRRELGHQRASDTGQDFALAWNGTGPASKRMLRGGNDQPNRVYERTVEVKKNTRAKARLG
jgi:hypothetical protein